jgi:hypothetical protein
MRQYFYMVAYTYDECTIPRKIFLQEHDAVRWGRREAANKLLETKDINYEYVLYKQEITRIGDLQKVKTLKPFPLKELVKEGLISVPHFDDDCFGADYDIDKERL